MKRIIFFFGIALLMLSCASEVKVEPVTNAEDYDRFLSSEVSTSAGEAKNEVEFWSKRLNTDTTGVGDLGPLAGAYQRLFDANADPEQLENAARCYRRGMEISANNKDIYARGLARTYISQHKFREAEAILRESYAGISSKRASEMMLFDVLMEVGKYEEAETFLDKVKNNSDYNYLIRKAKWSDHTGDLTNAINYLESARDIAKSRDSKSLKIWTYSNLADFYGHAGRIKEAYNHYLKTLELQPDNAYAKQGIAWIVYSYERNDEEALRILDSVIGQRPEPSLFLLKADMLESMGEHQAAESARARFIEEIENKNFGRMYNTYLVEYYAETDPARAVAIAREEVEARATPETYSLLAFSALQSGDEGQALKLIENHVSGKTFEPMAAYYSALVYKANGKAEKVAKLKSELIEASFELGPILSEKIEKL